VDQEKVQLIASSVVLTWLRRHGSTDDEAAERLHGTCNLHRTFNGSVERGL
jgi:hypothetical protein